MTRFLPTTVLLLAIALMGCQPTPEPSRNDIYHATLWFQTAPEYRATALQAYAAARSRAEEALADPSWSADIVQRTTGGYEAFPPAVILDLDETVLDNSAYEARLITDDSLFAPGSWDAWVEERVADEIPGALAFTQWAASQGIAVVYVSNRDSHMEEATRDNLEALGFPVDSTFDAVLLRGETEEWAVSDKSPRRAHVARDHRILLLMGDALGDFLEPEPGADLSAHDAEWGRTWIAFPNPMYGSWARVVPNESVTDYRNQKLALLRTKR